MWWAATDPVAVEATALTIAERQTAEGRLAARGASPSSAVAYISERTALPHSLLTESDYAFLSIGPAEIDFGVLPEQRRITAPRHSRTTVSTFDEEIQIYKERGDSIVRAERQNGLQPLFIIEPRDTCTGGGGGSSRPMGVAIPSGKTYSQCYQPGAFDASVDRDQDGVDDGCEAELAVAFRPQLVFDIYDCETRRQPYFAVRQKQSPDWGGVILLFYAISYRYDCGPQPHRGDSEWIILEVGPSLNSSYAPWSLKYGTLSAHWKAPNDNTAGYEASDLEDAEGSPRFGAPRVWVSEGKHANYRTQTVCNTSGFWWNWDNCDHPYSFFFTLDFTGAHNLGSSGVQFIGGPNSPVYDRLDNSGLYEYYWHHEVDPV